MKVGSVTDFSSRLSRGEARRNAIMEAARDIFLERGFGAATVEEIVRRAGGSRATLYEHFSNKEGLFAAIIARVCDSIVEPLVAQNDTPRDFEDMLHVIGHRYLQALMNPVGLALYRLVVGESTRFPELGRKVYAAGPETAARELAAYFRREASRSDLSIADADLAARHFLELVKGDLHSRALLGVETEPPLEAIDACVRQAVRTFLYGIRSIWRAH